MGYAGQHEFAQDTFIHNSNAQNTRQVRGSYQIFPGLSAMASYLSRFSPQNLDSFLSRICPRLKIMFNLLSWCRNSVNDRGTTESYMGYIR